MLVLHMLHKSALSQIHHVPVASNVNTELAGL
jgi:hypothetical protein